MNSVLKKNFSTETQRTQRYTEKNHGNQNNHINHSSDNNKYCIFANNIKKIEKMKNMLRVKKMQCVYIAFLLLVLFTGCKTKEERQIIGKWKLVDIKATLRPDVVATEEWGYYLDEDKSMIFIFKRNGTFTHIKKDGANSDTVIGRYILRDESIGLALLLVSLGDFYDITFDEQKMSFKRYIYTFDTPYPPLTPPDYFTYIFKKVK